MLCRYKCSNCDDWHALAGVHTEDLVLCWMEFMARPPEPFSRQIWDMLLKLEMRRRGVHI